MRCVPRGRVAMAPSQPITRAGISDGVALATTANRIEAVAPADHDRADDTMASTRKGSAACATTAPRCPV